MTHYTDEQLAQLYRRIDAGDITHEEMADITMTTMRKRGLALDASNRAALLADLCHRFPTQADLAAWLRETGALWEQLQAGPRRH